MRITDVIARSGRSLKSAKGRTILTALAIAVGGFTLTATLAAGNGIRQYTDNLVKSNFDPAELLVGRDKEVSNTGSPNTQPKEYDDDTANINFGGGGGGSNSLAIKQVTDGDIAELRQLSYADRVREEYQLSVRYITREGQKKYAVSAMSYNPSQRPELVAGKLPASSDIEAGTILIPEAYVSVLGFGSSGEAVGKQVQINVQEAFSLASAQALLSQAQSGGGLNLETLQASAAPDKTLNMTIVGVTKKSATSFSFGALPALLSAQDARTVYDFTAKGTSNYGKYLYAYVHVAGGEDESKLQAARSDLESKGYFVLGSKEIQKSITQIVDILQILVGVFGLITIIASIFGIVNTQYISVLERTREIGLMKALGMRSRDVRRLFMIEAGWIGFLGGAIGAIAAVLVGKSLNPWISKKLSLGNDLLIFRPLQILGLITVLILVAIVAGFLPARKAAKLDPIEALRTE